MSDVKAGERAHNNGHVYQWITDRQPTAVDANGAGAVRIRKYPNGSSSAAVHWSFIGDGVPWQHCNDWSGIHSSDDADRYVDAEGNDWRWADGAWHLVSEEPAAQHTSTAVYDRLIEQGSYKASRQFVAISRAFGPHGQHFIDAVASDGTAWYQDLSGPVTDRFWYQHVSLPEVTQ